ncbi:MAG: hypothetical protein JWM85_3490 [Acidimicrobiaceae bacterium]|nr:hypothetical protein [Acidimicrobiaceae bacterium]
MGGLSITEQLAELPIVRDYVHDVKGLVLRLPRTGLVVVPVQELHRGWNCVVVIGNETYRRGGYDIYVSNNELRRAPIDVDALQ